MGKYFNWKSKLHHDIEVMSLRFINFMALVQSVAFLTKKTAYEVINDFKKMELWELVTIYGLADSEFEVFEENLQLKSNLIDFIDQYNVNADSVLIDREFIFKFGFWGIDCYFEPYELIEIDYFKNIDIDWTDYKVIVDIDDQISNYHRQAIENKLSNIIFSKDISNDNQVYVDNIINFITSVNLYLDIGKNNLEIRQQNITDYGEIEEQNTSTSEIQTEITQLKEQLAQAQQATPASSDSKNDDFQKIQRKNGLSYKKTLAKSIAEHIAQTEWKKDTEENIKSSEMADIVYKKLIGLDFTDELPQEINSLKSWFKDVTPEYAQKGGRKPKDS